MKAWLFLLLGLLLAGMAWVSVKDALAAHGDPIQLLLGVAFAWGAISAFRAAHRASPEPQPLDKNKTPGQ